MPAVSIIIPAYNHARFLPDAINSVLNQTFRDYEIIVVDDGSMDNTCQIVSKYGNSVRYLFQENRGLSAARNNGIKNATGAYIVLLDADDFYHTEFLAVLISSLENDSTLTAAYCGSRFAESDKTLAYQKNSHVVKPEELHETLLTGNFIAAHCMMVRREAYEHVGLFDESLTACEDWDLWLRLTKQFLVGGVPEIFAFYRLASGSMSSAPAKMLQNRLVVLEKHIGPLECDSNNKSLHAYAKAYLLTGLEYIQLNQLAQANDCLQKAFSLYRPLAGQLETFYELALWDQPKGWRGDLSRIDPATNERKLIPFLKRLFDTTDDVQMTLWKKQAFARAYEALGLISYGRRELSAARRYWIRAMTYSPGQAFDPHLIAPFAKSLLGRRMHGLWQRRHSRAVLGH